MEAFLGENLRRQNGNERREDAPRGKSVETFTDQQWVTHVAITREQVRLLNEQQNCSGKYRLVDGVLGCCEQVIANDIELADNVRLGLSRLFGKSLRVLQGKHLPHWPTPWLRDSFLQATDQQTQQRVFLVSDPYHWIRNISDIKDFFADTALTSHSMGLRFLPHYFEGGDMIAVGQRLFLGMNTILRTRYFESVAAKRSLPYEDVRSRLIKRFSSLFGREVFVLDAVDIPPLFHLDLYVMPLLQPNGNPTFLVADVKSFIDDIAGMSLVTMREEQEFYDYALQQELSGSPLEFPYYFQFETYLHDVHHGPLVRQYNQVQSRLDRIADMLKQKFSVVRVPLPYIAQERKYREPIAVYLPDEVRGKNDCCYDDDALVFSPLNTVVTSAPRFGRLRQNVFGGHYGFRRSDRAFMAAVNKMGATLHLQPGFLHSAYRGGGVHCHTSEWRKGFVASGTVFDQLNQCL